MVLILKEIVSFEIIETPSVLYSFSTDIAMSIVNPPGVHGMWKPLGKLPSSSCTGIL